MTERIHIIQRVICTPHEGRDFVSLRFHDIDVKAKDGDIAACGYDAEGRPFIDLNGERFYK